jgi:hypothetical protein
MLMCLGMLLPSSSEARVEVSTERRALKALEVLSQHSRYVGVGVGVGVRPQAIISTTAVMCDAIPHIFMTFNQRTKLSESSSKSHLNMQRAKFPCSQHQENPRILLGHSAMPWLYEALVLTARCPRVDGIHEGVNAAVIIVAKSQCL